ncbi:MAG: GDSL-type esterase/lipase family protein [Clostridia bacterium]|nr:GDSL-type esterase/lipase family protein [Clostridia bacterium]MDR3645488.1 GDSL-type esterase/lipase family protein [Clostridia bacterium]
MANGKGSNSNKSLRGNYLLPIIAAVLAVAAIGAAIWMLFSQMGGGSLFGANTGTASSKVSGVASSSESSAVVSSSQAVTSYSSTSLNEASWFNNTVFIGDACTLGITTYKIADNATVLAGNGLSAYSALKYKIKLNGQSQTIMTAIAAKKPKRIYILLGSNDLTFLKSADQFTGPYGALLDALKQQLPDATIYVQSILPVTASYEIKKPTITNTRIDEFNSALKALCDQKSVKYVDVEAIFKGPDGMLPKSLSTDGLNIRPKCYYQWLNYLSQNR